MPNLGVILNLFLAIIGFSFLILSHEFGHFVAAKIFRIKVEEFAIGFGPSIANFKLRGTVYSLRIIPFGGFNKLQGEEGKDLESQSVNSFLKKPPSIRAATLFFGPIMNYLFALMLFFIFFMMGVQAPTTKIAVVVQNSAAETAGFKAGDSIIFVNGVKVKNWEDIVSITQVNANRKVDFVIKRDSEEISLSPTIGIMDGKGFLGIGPELEKKYTGVLNSAGNAFKATGSVTVFYAKGIAMLFSGKLTLEQARPVSPIGIVDMTRQVAQSGFQNYLFFVGMLSIILGISNLFPLLPFDGGHLLLLIIEKIRGRPVKEKTQKMIASFGIALVLLIFAFAIVLDIFKPIDLSKL